MALTLVAAYDVSDDDRRSRLAALLQSVGDRVQKSVFVLSIGPEEFRALVKRATGLIDVDEDSLYFFHQCAGCWEQLGCVGQADPPEKVLYWAVL